MKRAVTDGSHFYHVLDANTKPSSVEYRVTHSSGFEPVATGWGLREGKGKGVGIYVTDLETNFPGKVDLQSDKVILDLSAAEADEKGEINLDPTIIDTASVSLLYRDTLNNPANTWAQNLDAVGNLQVQACAVFHNTAWNNVRSGIRFDTTGYPRVSSARLVLTQMAVDLPAVDPWAVVVGDDGLSGVGGGGLITDLDNYQVIRLAFQGSNAKAAMTFSTPTWTSGNLAADWVETTKFDIGVFGNVFDGAGRAVPSEVSSVDFDDIADAVPPFLLVTRAGGAALLLMD